MFYLPVNILGLSELPSKMEGLESQELLPSSLRSGKNSRSGSLSLTYLSPRVREAQRSSCEEQGDKLKGEGTGAEVLRDRKPHSWRPGADLIN